MQIIDVYQLNECKINEDIEIALGHFDGIHKGHQALIECLNGPYKKALLTFDKSIKSIVTNTSEEIINSITDKEEFLRNRVDYFIILHVNNEIMNSSKDQFIQFLKNNHVKRVVCGKDYTFAKNKEGTIKDLSIFDLNVVHDVIIHQNKVSTTLIKSLIKEGKIENIKDYLGYDYFIKGEIIHGNHLGRTIGFPTINIDYNEYITPALGVYAGIVIIDSKQYFGMINVGHNPTFNLRKNISIEMNIFDLDENLYGKYAKIIFKKHIRTEIKFATKEALIEQLECDRISCKNYLNNACKSDIL